jgi:hypothetical protein
MSGAAMEPSFGVSRTLDTLPLFADVKPSLTLVQPERRETLGIEYQAPSVPSPTSELASDRVMTREGRKRRETRGQEILALIVDRGGCTSDEIDADTGFGSGTICSQIDGLRTTGYILTSKTDRRDTRRGSPAAVHYATDKGQRFVTHHRSKV